MCFHSSAEKEAGVAGHMSFLRARCLGSSVSMRFSQNSVRCGYAPSVPDLKGGWSQYNNQSTVRGVRAAHAVSLPQLTHDIRALMCRYHFHHKRAQNTKAGHKQITYRGNKTTHLVTDSKHNYDSNVISENKKTLQTCGQSLNL